jgi:chromosome segregation ATPase
LEARLQAVNADSASLQERLQASQREADAAKQDAAVARQQLAELTEQLTLARAAFDEAKLQLVTVTALNDELRRKDAWEKHVDGGSATLQSPGKAGTTFAGSHSLGMAVAAATANLGDWRTWATGKA